MHEGELLEYMDECRELVVAEIRDILPKTDRYRSVLYDLILDYPLREAKAIRPSLCVATCRGLGGRMEAVLRSAAVLEFYHNAFLVHDDVEDGSEFRRDLPTLHRTHGVPIAVNVGDAMLALALEPLLENMASLGLGKAIRILQLVGRMARETAEGQALELGWIRTREWTLTDTDYLRMVYKKTSWYTFVAPMLAGAIVAGAEPACLLALRKFAVSLGLAFQIQDDVLNLTAERTTYGKEIGGDLWEGKHTLILIHALRSARPTDRRRAQAILAKPRPTTAEPGADDEDLVATTARLGRLVDELRRAGDLTPRGQARLRRVLTASGAAGCKTDADVAFLRALISQHGSIAAANSWRRSSISSSIAHAEDGGTMAGEAKFGEDAWGASLDALTLQLRGLHELRKTLDPEYREARQPDARADPQAGQMQKYLFGLAQLQLDHFRQVLEFSTKHFDYVMEQLRRGGRLGTPWMGTPPHLNVQVRAPIGGQVAETFTIHNFRGRPTAMRFSTTDFVREGGAERVAAAVAIEPRADTFTSVLEPHGAAEFRMSFPVDSRFTAPARYCATTYVMDDDTVAGRVTIELETTPAARAHSERARATRPRSKGRRRAR